MKLLRLLLLCAFFAVALSSDVVVTTKTGFSEWGLFGPESYLPLGVYLGDKVIFRWNGFHTLDQFNNITSYAKCDFNGSMELANTSRPCEGQAGFLHCYTWTASQTGTFFFGCRVPGHCTPGGMKVEVTVKPQPVLNCTYQNQTYPPGDTLCLGGALWVCSSGTFVSKNETCAPPPAPEKCEFQGHLFANGDYICDLQGRNYQCRNFTFHFVGPCEVNQLVNCSSLQVKCATAFSTAWNLPLVYCGQDGKLNSAKTLCYPSSDEYWCDNNRLGTGVNWLMRASDAVHFGEPCPEF